MKLKTELSDLTKQAEALVVAVEKLTPGSVFRAPADAAREAVARLREEAGGPLFPVAVAPIPPGVLEAWNAYGESFTAAALHGAALRSFASLAEFGRGLIVRARVRRAGANAAVPATEMITPGEPVRQTETAAQAAARGADEAEQMFMESSARHIVAARDVPALADLIPAAEAFVTSCDLGRRLTAAVEPRERAAKAAAEAIEREALAAEEAILAARRTALIQFFDGLATTEFPEIQSIGGEPVEPGRTVTAASIALALAEGHFGAAGHADELERAEKIRDNYRARVRREADRVEQLAAAATTR